MRVDCGRNGDVHIAEVHTNVRLRHVSRNGHLPGEQDAEHQAAVLPPEFSSGSPLLLAVAFEQLLNVFVASVSHDSEEQLLPTNPWV